MSPIPSECGSEVEKIKRKLQTFKFDDNGVPGLLRQQLEDYKELRKQLKSAVQVNIWEILTMPKVKIV